MNKPIRVLILEDRAIDAEMNIRELRRAGFDPQWKRVETEADYLSELDNAPDLILADYGLPHFDGLSAAKLLRERKLDIPFILISGTIGEEAAVEAIKHGATDYLLKDRIVRLGAAVERALEEKRLRTDQRQAQEKLLASEARYRRLFEAARDGILILNADSGCIEDANPFMVEMLGYSSAEFLGRQLWELGFFKDIVSNKDAFLKLQSEGYIRYDDLPLKTKNGRAFWAEFVSNIYAVNGTQVIQCNIRDISERRRAEMALKESQLRYFSLFENMLEGFAYCRILLEQGKPVDFIYLEVNRAFEKLTSLKDVVGKKVSDVIPGIHQTNPEILDTYAKVALTGKPETYETHLSSLGIWLSVSVYSYEKEHFVAVFENITERKVTEAAMSASLEEFRTLAEAMPQIVWITRADGWNIYFNRHWMDYTGLSLEESLGHGWNKPFHPEDQPRAWAAWQHAIATIGTYSLECRLRRRDGEYRWWLIRGIPQQDAAGKILKWFGTCTDIHDMKLAELKISDANREMRDSNEKFNLLADNIGDAFWIRSPDMREVQYISPAFERIWGRSVESLYANPQQWADFTFPEDRERVRSAFATIVEDTPTLDIEYRIVRPDGEVRWVRARGFQVRDAAHKLIRLTGIVTDITERKQADEAFTTRAAELELFHEFSVGRELQMVELKKEVNEMAKLAGGVPPYDLSFLDEAPALRGQA